MAGDEEQIMQQSCQRQPYNILKCVHMNSARADLMSISKQSRKQNGGELRNEYNS